MDLLTSIIQAYLGNEKLLTSHLSEEAQKALAITSHIKADIRSKSDFVNRQVLNHWYIVSTSLLRKVVKKEFYTSLKKPESYVNPKNYKNNCVRIIKDLESKIRKFPEEVTIKMQSSELTNTIEIIPTELTNDTRGYISKISKQINSTYKNSDFDACSILMRRLFEIMLILVYRNHNKENLIQQVDGRYKNLSSIIKVTRSDNQFNFSQIFIKTMDEFRMLGNHAAHRIEYNCFKKEIDDVKREFRVSIEEMLYKSGIKK